MSEAIKTWDKRYEEDNLSMTNSMKQEITELRARVAEQEKLLAGEPVAWAWDEATYGENDVRGRQWAPRTGRTKPTNPWMTRNETPLFTHPARQPMSAEQIVQWMPPGLLRNEEAYYQRGIKDAEQFHGITGEKSA